MRPPRDALSRSVTDTAVLSDELKSYLDEEKVYATVATVGANGHPHLTVVWIKREGDELLFSTTVARQQAKNLVRDPRITVMVNPPERPFLYAEIRGTATTIPDPERALPDEMSLKYTGKPYREFNPASVDDAERVIVRITPHRVAGRL
ncbi:pyridoxamine 5'-phosphate oxidase [Nocardia sp. MH4]|nr:pyridoxamine 5'-phosphate oxidase [Nocardia sp. MH4]